MPNPFWGKKKTDEPFWQGPRVADLEEAGVFDWGTQVKMETILDAMDWPQLIIFRYDGSDRVVAPFVLGVSSEGNPLMRGYKVEGVSKSGRGEGWRVFQVKKMEDVENHHDFFYPEEFQFEEFYPWTFRVFKMLEGGTS